MSTEQQSILEWLEENSGTPEILTTERTTNSKYLFYLLVRHYRKRLRPGPRFYTFAKADQMAVKSIIEEHSFLDQDGTFYVLEGFSQRFIDTLNPAPKTWILAETDGGLLKAPSYTTNHTTTRSILKTLIDQLNLKSQLTLRGLLKMDWTALRSYEEYEPILRRAKILGTTEDELEKELEPREWEQSLVLTKRGRDKELLQHIDMLSPVGAHRHLLHLLADVLHYRALRTLGYEEKKSGETVGAGWRRTKELEETNNTLSAQDLQLLADRVVSMDSLMLRRPDLGVVLFYLNNPVSVRKR